MPLFEIVVTQTNWGSVVIEAVSLEAAKQYAEDNLDDLDYRTDMEGDFELSDVTLLDE